MADMPSRERPHKRAVVFINISSVRRTMLAGATQDRKTLKERCPANIGRRWLRFNLKATPKVRARPDGREVSSLPHRHSGMEPEQNFRRRSHKRNAGSRYRS